MNFKDKTYRQMFEEWKPKADAGLYTEDEAIRIHSYWRRLGKLAGQGAGASFEQRARRMRPAKRHTLVMKEASKSGKRK